MAAISAAQVNTYTDKLAVAYLSLAGTLASTYGCGDGTQTLANDWGASKAMRQILDAVVGTPSTPGWGDYDLEVNVVAAVAMSKSAVSYQQVVKNLLNTPFAALNAACVYSGSYLSISSTVSSLATWLSYYNYGTGGAWTALVAPEFSTLYNILNVTALDARNIYSPTITNMGSRAYGGSFSAGTAVNTTNYAGAGSLIAYCTSISGTGGTVTVTCNGRSASGTTVTGRTFTGTIANTPATQSVVLSPSVAGDIATSVTGITLPGGLTGSSTVTIQARPPSGRTSPPT